MVSPHHCSVKAKLSVGGNLKCLSCCSSGLLPFPPTSQLIATACVSEQRGVERHSVVLILNI